MTIHVTLWNPEWSLEIMRDDRDLETAAQVHWPTSIYANSTVLQHERGLVWIDKLGARFIPFCETLPDGTDVNVHHPTQEQDVWHGLASLRRVAIGGGDHRAPDVVRAFLSALHLGVLGDALSGGAHAFDNGLDTSGEAERMVAHALEARLLLPDALYSLDNQGLRILVQDLTGWLSCIDEHHAKHGSALQLLDEATYEELVGRGHPLDHGSWWGSRAKLDATVPAGVVDVALLNLGGKED